MADPEDTGQQALLLRLVDSLGEADWRERQAAVTRLTEESSPWLAGKLVDILRHSNRDLSRLNAALQILACSEVDVVPALLELLTHSDADVRTYVALALGERGDIRAIPALIAALADGDTNVRIHAIEALGKLRAGAAVDRLLEFATSGEFELAFPALDALMAIGDERVAPFLTPILLDPLLKNAAIEALGALGNEESIAPLCDALDEGTTTGVIAQAIRQIYERWEVRFGSGENIAKFVRQAGTPSVITAFRSAVTTGPGADVPAIVTVLGWFEGEEVQATLLDCLDRLELRRCATDALAAQSAEIVPALLNRFSHASIEGQLSILELCGRIADRRAIPLLAESLQTDDDEVLIKALDVLTRITDERLYVEIKGLLGHSNSRIRQGAVAALNALGHPDTATDMRQLLLDPSPLVRDSALRVASYFGFEECIDLILACCEDPNERVSRTAIEHLPCLEDSRLEDSRIAAKLERALISNVPSLRAAAAGALGEVDASLAIPLLLKALDDQHVWVRYFAIRSLARFNDRGKFADRFLAIAKGDPAMQVRIAAVESLGTESLGMEAISDLAEFATSTDEDLASAALATLAATRHSDALPPLIAAAKSEQSRKQVDALRALGKSGLAGAVAPLAQAALGRNPILIEEGILGLSRIRSDESVDALLEVLTVPSKRSAGIAALKTIGDAAISRLAYHLQQLTLDVRRALMEVLIGIRSTRAIELLETALEDPEPAVRHAALSGLACARPTKKPQSRALSNGDA